MEQIKVFIKDFKEVPKLATSKLNQEHVNQLKDIQQLSEQWQFNSSMTVIKREFEFPTFKESFAFMSSVSDLSEKMEHYPKWYNKGNKVIVEITTPSVGLTIKDILLAYTMDNISNDILNEDIQFICQQSKLTSQSTTLLNWWNKNYSKYEEEISSQFQRNVNQI
ncbi:unnamed protein product (macronuclear) [Paramecium tetraurelia]|uniref:4a-hydroxytetrahydrobiopterin dehydratase n=1 Tax=Paramecium tetraurelia TaxID=5888 RepID=A0E1D7_PARTE|nr:uncharacterized protein GSPATT00022273001 [Paramecium tetraurelia]CAK89104.1 unnamed protein product [Paramecium tetraurelia]|eukprot:XP_001456501.1 hypothetical protein (macronuclear) [Paramecium tetraurelia strain d4-2]